MPLWSKSNQWILSIFFFFFHSRTSTTGHHTLTATFLSGKSIQSTLDEAFPSTTATFFCPQDSPWGEVQLYRGDQNLTMPVMSYLPKKKMALKELTVRFPALAISTFFDHMESPCFWEVWLPKCCHVPWPITFSLPWSDDPYLVSKLLFLFIEDLSLVPQREVTQSRFTSLHDSELPIFQTVLR